MAAQIRQKLNSFSPRTDNLGNLYITLGSGAPHKLLVTPIDEPGYVISGITSDGYLRVQRLPQAPPNPVFDLLHSAQPVWVITRTGKRVPGVFAGLSVHLQTLRLNMPKMSHPDEMYVDVGASSTEEVHAAGVELLDPVALNRTDYRLGSDEYTAPAIGDRFGCVALTDLFTELRLDKAKLRGTVTVAFVTQQWTGGRGLERLLREVHPDEMIYVGRLLQARPAGGAPASSRVQPGTGILLGVADPSAPLSGLGLELEKQSDRAHRRLNVQAALAPRIAGYTTPTGFPERFAQLSLPVLFPVTPAETVSMRDVGELTELLFQYAAGAAPMGGLGGGHGGGCGDCGPPLLPDLVETYGASGHEDAVRKKVQAWLNPKYSPKKKVETRIDTAGNLILHLGDAKPEAKTPKILFVAHMDEIGYQVRSLEPDGRLLVDVLGGGYTEYFLGHVVLVHKGDGTTSGGVLELPEGWDRPGFEWPHGPRGLDEPAHVYVGTRSSEETQKLGIKAGDWITIPKQYRPLLGTRANARSFDDRVGCAVLIEAVRTLGLDLPGRDVTFVWSTEEEVGLKGAAAVAERMAKEGKTPDFVFAIDTFVSSDSPLESKRFADAEIGKGFVIRAVDNSNITPREYVQRVIRLARENNIPVQYGVTGGGNDGAVFQRFGAVDIPLGWPLRYSHSPGEVIDTRDVDALAKIIAVLAKNW
ncbi:MAG TPA: M20/M25/M40 family metallo-hydrolase [Candidatus Acidoferrum sp.]|nr:M20/M25/M40 family metallo-hydrolase [Candidatus Acidoferrum sp.]